MSRWTTNFKNHQFQSNWKVIKEEIDDLTVDDESIVPDTEELARLVKVITYLDSLLSACDPELIPPKIWDAFNTQSQNCLNNIKSYKASKNRDNLATANEHADNLLGYVRPYVVSGSDSAKASSNAFKAFSKSINNQLSEFANKYKELSSEISGLFRESKSFHDQITNILSSFKEAETRYLQGDDESDSVLEQIETSRKEIKKFEARIGELRNTLLEEYGGTGSIESVIKDKNRFATETAENIKRIHSEMTTELERLRKFYYEVFGKENDEGEFEGGLKNEIQDRQDDLDSFKNKQEERYKALNAEIESLLPGATSAGLASAYKAQKDSYSDPIKNQSLLFYFSIAAIVVLALVASIETWSPLKFESISNVEGFLKSISFKLPVILPLIWLAAYASKRRSEAQRLQQEYAHKEALAKSYQNFKDQIDQLDDTNAHAELTKKLLDSAIQAVSANASVTLDGKHGDNTPAVDAIEKLTEKFDKVSENIKKNN